jgi:hypothetical protein
MSVLQATFHVYDLGVRVGWNECGDIIRMMIVVNVVMIREGGVMWASRS